MKQQTLLYWIGSIAALVLSSCYEPPPTNLGVNEGMLRPCPPTWNCVWSQTYDTTFSAPAFVYRTSLEDAREELLEVLKSMDRCKVVTAESNYIHAEVRSEWLNIVDDLEFYLKPTQNVIDFRSSSRIGYYDKQMNRKRIEWIRRECGFESIWENDWDGRELEGLDE